MKNVIGAGVLLLLTACGDPADFRPAKGVADYPSSKDAYRIKEVDPSCTDIGGVVQAESLADVAETAARHGGTHYRILDDFGHSTVETETTGRVAFGAIHAHSTSEEVKHHRFVARVYRCE